MVEMEERELLLQSLKGYLEELRESGVEELCFAGLSAPAPPGQVDQPGEAARRGGEEPGRDPAGLCRSAGNPKARLAFVMAGAGLAGPAGDLLAKIIKAMEFDTSEVCLLSFPAGLSGAASATRAELLRRIEAGGPEVVVALGDEAAQLLLQSREPVGSLRGRFHELAGRALMATLHPEALLADPSLKREVWNEMKQVMQRLARS